MAKVQLEQLNKSFGAGRVVRDLDLTVEDGAFTVLVGPSGCGKSTILRMIAGLEEADGGTVSINGKPVNDLEPARRNVAMVFQNYALYPHMTVYKNLAFPLRMRGEKKDQIDAKVREAAEILGIAEMLDRKPRTLSGGQMQRVALGRAIVRNPLVFLFDEPLSNLDAKMRVEMRAEIRRLHRKLGTTMIYVTHDQEEAMTMGSRIAVLDGGVLQQEGEPMEVYHRPANRFTAAFIGSPAMNFFDGAVLNGVFTHRGFRVLAEGVPEGPAVLGVRPHDIIPAGQELVAGNPDSAAAADPGDKDQEEDDTPYEEKEAYTESVEVRVDLVEPLGSETQVHCIAGKTPFLVSLSGHHPLRKGETVQLRFEPAKIHFFHAETGARIA